MNLQQKGYHRDKLIISEIESKKALSTDQIIALFFYDMKWGKRKAQERLKKIYDRKQIKRTRCSPESPFVYYTDKKSGQLDHLISTNWVYVWLYRSCSQWEHMWYWGTEIDYGILRCDALCGIKNNFTNTVDFYFIELDRSSNRFDKIEKYNAFYTSGKYLSQWWVKYTDKFPVVLCVTEHLNRVKLIKDSIERNNSSDLRFRVYLLDDLINKVNTVNTVNSLNSS